MNLSPSRRIASALASAVIAALPALASAATTDNWTGTTGNWSIAANWTTAGSTHVVPQTGDTVLLTSTDGVSRTITFDPASVSLSLLEIDLTGGISTATETLSITAANTLTSTTEYVGYSGAGGTNGSGTVNQTSGTQTLTGIYLAVNATDRGFYTLGGGALSGLESIGYAGTGTFTQTGGTNNANNGLTIGANGTGSYSLSAGSLTYAISLLMGSASGSQSNFTLSGTGTISAAADETVGGSGNATFTQNGGSNTLSANLSLSSTAGGSGTFSLSSGTTSVNNAFIGGNNFGTGGKGILNISGGQFTTSGNLTLYTGQNSKVNLSGGTLTVSGLNLFNIGTNFNWTGGSLVWTSTFGICIDNGVFSNFPATVTLNPTQNLTSAAAENIGQTTGGSFTQAGGNNTLTGASSLFLATTSTASGSYTLNAGTLSLASGFEYIGFNGYGAFNQTGGTNTVPSGQLILGNGAGSTGVYTLSGGTLSFTSALFVSSGGNGYFTQTGGLVNGTGSFPTLFIGVSNGATGSYQISGGTLSLTGQIIIAGSLSGLGGTGTLSISNGSVTATGGAILYNTPNSGINLTGGTLALGSLNVNGTPSLFHWTGGNLSFLSGLTLDPSAGPTSNAAAFGSAYTLGTNQSLAVTGAEVLGGTQPFSLTLSTGSTNTVTGATTISAASTLFLNGGAFSGASMLLSGINARVNEQAPSSLTAANLTVTNGALFLATQGGVFTFTNVVTSGSNGAEIFFDGNAAVSATSFDVGANTLVSDGSAAIAASAFVFLETGSEFRLGNANTSIVTTPLFQVSGLLDGSGRINGRLQVFSTGEVDLTASQSLTVTGSANTNAGLISLTGGTLHFTQGLTNVLAITGYGTLRVDGGLINNASLALGGQASSLFGNITNANTGFLGLAGNTTVFSNIANAGSVRLSGAGANIFYGSFSNTGSLSIDANATGIFYGPYSGNAAILNSGSLFINSGAVTGAVIGTGNLTLGAPLVPANAQVTPGSGASKLASLTLNATSQLDLTTNALILQPANASLKAAAISQLAAEVLSGRNGGAWNGPGITSSTAAANAANISIAILDNASLGYTTFQGQLVDANSILVVPALFGDANVDGRVDLNDLNTVLNHLGTTTGAWTSGNFDGAATIDLNDLNAVLNHLGVTFTPALAAASAPLTPALTPEPASLALLAAGTLWPLLRRRNTR